MIQPSDNTGAFNVLTPASLDWDSTTRISVQARLVGERLILKTLETTDPLATNPLMTRAGKAGCAVLLRYGVVVLFNLTALEAASFLETLKPFVKEPKVETVTENLALAFKSGAPDQLGKERIERDVLWLRNNDVERLQIVAEALAKSVVLEYYEAEIAKIFDRMQVFATAIQNQSARPPKEHELLRDVGGTLLIQQKMLGSVEVGEKPDPIWDHPELDRLYLRLEDEYELRERLLALERKLDLIAKTVETVLGILQRDSSHRVEWYIVILIVVEILLSVYDLWIKG
ncbi:RMD1 family protein [filamentous cyanobacterium LEGE 11480]|uniref:RMD1 family protein n=1 Tax=Romeriopsis navalis LEGE 11480 TaxID=2777977 RepID=A0A928VMM6_9CYAN|nr:RMD1 family protein [Romeriopsis navalis]MBE9029471.1 RMD1 family protein [Romeriopsis navalis LEGE 11480]